MSEQQNIITYTTQIIDSKKANWRKETTHEEIDNFDFQKHFIEVLDKPEYIRPYFDFDDIETLEDYEEVISWLDSLNLIFGPYAIGGYTSKEEFTMYGFKLIPEAHHILSFHAIFYTKKIKSDYMIELMKAKNKRFIYDNINKFCDPNVYKLDTRQLMRHPLSDKYYNSISKKNKTTAGNILYDEPPQNLILTINGREEEVNNDYLFDEFNLYIDDIVDNTKNIKQVKSLLSEQVKSSISEQVSEDEEPEPAKRSHHKKQATIDDLTYEDGLIKFNKDQLIEFINKLEIQNNTNGILCDLAPLWCSPFKKEFLIDIISEWYEQEEHDHPENVEHFINTYYHREYNNKWFFSLLKKFGTEEVRNEYIKQHKDNIDMSININNSNLSYDDVKETKYKIDNIPKLLNDLRGVVGNIDDKWYLKIIKNNQKFIITCSDETIRAKTKTFKPFFNNSKINLYQILSKYSVIFKYKAAKICKNCEDNIINLFQGYKYEEIITDDFNNIQPLLEHIKNIICCGDIDKYNYFMSWWGNVIQNITVKNCSMPIIYGGQGSGKSFVVETLSELLGNYALKNVDDLDKVFGKFNGLISSTLIAVINEPPEAGDKFSFNGKIKSKLTQKSIIQETKGIDQIEIECYTNYIMTTNSYCPVKEETGQRRFIYFETDNSKCGEEEYFINLCKAAQPIKQGDYNPEFMGVLLHYMLTQVDTTDFNAERLIREINSKTDVEYNEQLDRQFTDATPIERYVILNYKDFERGIGTDYIKRFMQFTGHTENSIARALNKYCNKKRIQKNGTRYMYYFLKPREQNQALYNLIDYKEFNGETEEITEEYFNDYSDKI